jgi:hypothetical protein
MKLNSREKNKRKEKGGEGWSYNINHSNFKQWSYWQMIAERLE